MGASGRSCLRYCSAIGQLLVVMSMGTLLAAGTSRSALPTCTTAMIGSVYTKCQYGGGMKRKVSYFEEECDETSPHAVSLPPVELLPCQCSAGQGISPITLRCDICDKGMYGPGGRVLDSVDWGNWTRCPSGLFLETDTFQMSTFCETGNFSVVTNLYEGSKCQPWRPGPPDRDPAPSSPPVSTPSCGQHDQQYTGAHEYLLSGVQPKGTPVLSVLHTVVQVINMPAMVEFTYFVDSTPCFDTTGGESKNCDGLSFYIDNSEMMTTQSQQLTWLTRRYSIEKHGFHSLRWQFRVHNVNAKDTSNQAAIRSIILVGVEGNTSCAACPPGKFAPTSNLSSCEDCPEFKYQDMTGQSECVHCPNYTYSLKGSSQCYPMKKCDLDDLVKHLNNISTCTHSLVTNQYVREETIDWLNHYGYSQPFCDKRALPPGSDHDRKVVCRCQPGQEFVIPKTGIPTCANCPQSRHSTDGITCYSCAHGSVTHGEMTITTWSELPAGFTSHCNGECDANGWLPNGNTLRTGYSTGSYDSQLVSRTFTVTHPTDGYISFECAVDCALVTKDGADDDHDSKSRPHSSGWLNPNNGKVSFTDHCHLEFYIQDESGLHEPVECAPPQSRDGTVMKHHYNLTAGQYRFTWYYHQVDVHYYQSIGMEARLSALSVGGLNSSLGGASKCITCPAGYHQNAEQTDCLPCANGTYSHAGSVNCTTCPVGYYASRAMSHTCEPCEAGYHTVSPSQCDPCPAGMFSRGRSAVCLICSPGTFSDKPGSPQCLPCGSGTTNTHDFTTCDNKQCQPGIELNHTSQTSTYLYNFLPLDNVNHAAVDNIRGHQFYFRLCNAQPSSRGCFNGTNQPLESKLCMSTCTPMNSTNCTAAKSFGKTIGWELHASASNVSVFVTNGDHCGSYGRSRSARVFLLCNLTKEADVGSPELLHMDDDECYAEFTWRSYYACPLCTENCYLNHSGSCGADGMRTDTRVMIQDCHQGNVTGEYTQPIKCITIYAIIGGAVAFMFFVFMVFYFVRSQHMRTQASRMVHSQRMQEKLAMMSEGDIDDDLVDSEFEEGNTSESGVETDDEMIE